MIFYDPPSGQVRCKFIFNHGEANGAQCWRAGEPVPASEAMKQARAEGKYVEGYLNSFDEEIEKSIKQLAPAAATSRYGKRD
jgi:hypothetical protein